jgi:hypothetical protein
VVIVYIPYFPITVGINRTMRAGMAHMTQILTRDEFRAAVFNRDNNCCVICGAPGQDAHHIMERRLFTMPDEQGGYFLDNGATLCGLHHLEAESTILSCVAIRAAAKIKNIILPIHLYPDDTYDKWGNPYLPNGLRMAGELFRDKSVQKVLSPVLYQFVQFVKYPRTWHLPWSPGATADDRVLTEISQFEGKEVVVTEKMDGECTTMYRGYMHARSIDSRHHPSRDWVKNLHAQIEWEIPEGYRICGENLFAVHSIRYDALPSYFMVFSIWDEENECLAWDDTIELCQLLGLEHVPVIYRGVWDKDFLIENPLSDRLLGREGYVVRLAERFPFHKFRNSVAKFVRAGHVTTHGHWMHGLIERNGLKDVPPRNKK